MPEAQNADNPPVEEVTSDRPILQIDFALYERHLTDSDLSEAEKRAFLESLWDIIVGFVDLGFGVHPIQQTAPHGWEQEQDLQSLMARDVMSSRKGCSTL